MSDIWLLPSGFSSSPVLFLAVLKKKIQVLFIKRRLLRTYNPIKVKLCFVLYIFYYFMKKHMSIGGPHGPFLCFFIHCYYLTGRI